MTAPDSLNRCPDCGKPRGYKGWHGPECQCSVKLGSAVKGAPSVGTLPVKYVSRDELREMYPDAPGVGTLDSGRALLGIHQWTERESRKLERKTAAEIKAASDKRSSRRRPAATSKPGR